MAGGERDRRRRGGGAGGSGGREVQVSKALSKLLRHGAEKEGLTLGAGGYINVQDVLQSRSIRPLKVTLSELSGLVASNEKQRFSLIRATASAEPESVDDAANPQQVGSQVSSADPASSPTDALTTQLATHLILTDADKPSDYLIRANQGHSIKIADNEGLLTPILAPPPAAGQAQSVANISTTHTALPVCVVHGTTRKAWPLIVASGGLKPMGRNHVHFATGLPASFLPPQQHQPQPQTAASSSVTSSTNTTTTTPPSDEASTSSAAPVISGMRNSSTVLMYLDLPRALAAQDANASLRFWRSANGVVLCDGGAAGVVPLALFKRVELRGPKGGVLLEDGVVVRTLE